MVAELEYVEHIRTESARFAACLATADRSARVPTCPDWNADDLLWHLTEVQLLWSAVVRDRLQEPGPAEAATPPRPNDLDGLLRLFAQATDALVDALATTPGDTEVWTWSDDHRVSFVRRWQAHEALIHRLDAELVASDPSAIDRDLASDGIDTVLTIVHGNVPSWATFTPDGTTGSVAGTDTARMWSLAFGRFLGTGPESGRLYDMDSIAIVDRLDAPDSRHADFEVRGSAAQLDAWLWGRGPVDAVDLDGDRRAFTRLAQIVSRGID